MNVELAGKLSREAGEDVGTYGITLNTLEDLSVQSGEEDPIDSQRLANQLLTARAVRYFLVVITAGLVWPLTFRWFAKLGRNEK